MKGHQGCHRSRLEARLPFEKRPAQKVHTHNAGYAHQRRRQSQCKIGIAKPAPPEVQQQIVARRMKGVKLVGENLLCSPTCYHGTDGFIIPLALIPQSDQSESRSSNQYETKHYDIPAVLPYALHKLALFGILSLVSPNGGSCDLEPIETEHK